CCTLAQRTGELVALYHLSAALRGLPRQFIEAILTPRPATQILPECLLWGVPRHDVLANLIQCIREIDWGRKRVWPARVTAVARATRTCAPTAMGFNGMRHG